MASTQGQDAMFCQLCTNPVEYHCNLCRVDLCSPCTLNHLADKTNRHEIVEFINRKKGHVLPECNSHKKHRCELFCRDCQEPMCILCVTTTHKKHEITDIEEIIQNSKKRIIDDLTELENDIVPAYRNVKAGVPSAEYDKVLSAIQNQEDAICKIVRDIGSQMRDEVTKQKDQTKENRETESLAARTEKELNGIILNNRSILNTSNVTAIMSYESKNQIFRECYNKLGLFYPNYLPGRIRNEQIYEMFGGFQMNKASKPLSLLKASGCPAFGSQSTGGFGTPSSSQCFNFGTSRNGGFNLGSTPQNAGSAFGGGFMDFGSKPPSVGLFGSSSTSGTGFSFGSSMPSHQSPNLFGSSNNLSGFTFGNANHK
ncbi:transcription intermediary factor 1-beta-like [Crassostrea angulata]|uniref:transcription intermediary factor 1-beta-like n=1 Tax=Magallana angulata TaxID=2784310 RepID=UPI0022B157BD|nr:transcription intermediary factor 1-beta-like [Crassostrea angulata]